MINKTKLNNVKYEKLVSESWFEKIIYYRFQTESVDSHILKFISLELIP